MNTLSCLIINRSGIVYDTATPKAYKNQLWAGQFSVCSLNGKIIEFCIQHIRDINDPYIAMIVCVSDGDIATHHIESCLRKAGMVEEQRPKNLIVATLAQRSESPNINYLYMPLDDTIFNAGIISKFPVNKLPDWHSRSNAVFWRGKHTGNTTPTLRYRVVDKLFGVPDTDCLFTHVIKRGYENPNYFSDRVDYTKFWEYKIFLIIDGMCIASNHMWGFAIGCVPLMISNARCWFQDLIVPFEHYIPVKHDLSDLMEQITWVREHDDDAKRISFNALELSHKIFSSSFQKQYLMDSINKCSEKACD